MVEHKKELIGIALNRIVDIVETAKYYDLMNKPKGCHNGIFGESYASEIMDVMAFHSNNENFMRNRPDFVGMARNIAKQLESENIFRKDVEEYLKEDPIIDSKCVELLFHS